MSTTVIHHSADYDGQFCGAIARKFIPDARIIGWDFGDPIPDVSKDDQLFIMDLCIDKLMEFPNLIWIDHHKSSIERWGEAGPGYYRHGKSSPFSCRNAWVMDGVAACRLAWQFFTSEPGLALPPKEVFLQRKVKEPMALTLAGEYDVWDHEASKGQDKDFQFGLDSMDSRLYTLEGLLETHGDIETHRLVWQGEIARRAFEKRMKDTASSCCFDLGWEGLTFLALNSPERGSFVMESQVHARHQAMLRFNFRNGQWIISMYHVPHRTDLDLSVLAVKYGGGGHAGACGFQCKDLPWLPERMIIKKKL